MDMLEVRMKNRTINDYYIDRMRLDRCFDSWRRDQIPGGLSMKVIDNNGIGALYATFYVTKTGDNYDLTTDDIGKAVVIVGDNMISFGDYSDPLLGRLEYIRDGMAIVQISGIARFKIANLKNVCTGKSVRVDGNGSVLFSRRIYRNTVLVNGLDTCEVLL